MTNGEKIDDVALRVRAQLDTSVGTYWRDRLAAHTQESYLGVPMSKLPEDLHLYERLLYESRADTVIELGCQFGGSTLWFRDRLRAMVSHGLIARARVVAVDIDIAPTMQWLSRATLDTSEIKLLEADVLDPSLPDIVAAAVPDGATCFVVEDSAHIYATTRAALEGFARFVPPGGWFVVEDGVVDVEELRPYDWWPRGVLPAITDWLATPQGSAFAPRRDVETYAITGHPGGFLQRVSSSD